MIIKATFHDNDFEAPLEGFFAKGLYGALGWANKALRDKKDPSTGDLILFRETSILIDKYLRMIQAGKDFSSKDLSQFKAILEKAFNEYITYMYSDKAEYLRRELEIDILDSVKDQWENGEVLYFFPIQNKYIIM